MSNYKIKSQKEFLTRFMPLARRHGLSEVWTDFVQANRYALECAMQPDNEDEVFLTTPTSHEVGFW